MSIHLLMTFIFKSTKIILCLFQIPHDNVSNLSHSPQVSRSLQSTALARHTPTAPWSHSLTRAQEENHRAPSPPHSTGARYPIMNSHVPVPQSYGSSPGVDRGIQSSLLSLASDPYGGSKKMCTDRCKMNSLQNNPSKLIGVYCEAFFFYKFSNLLQGSYCA